MKTINASALAATMILIASSAWADTTNQSAQTVLNNNGSLEVQVQPQSQTQPWSQQQLEALQNGQYSSIVPVLQNKGIQTLSQAQSVAITLAQVPIFGQIPSLAQLLAQTETIVILTGNLNQQNNNINIGRNSNINNNRWNNN